METKVAGSFCSHPTAHRLRFLLYTVLSDHLQWSSLLTNESLSVLSPIIIKMFRYTSHAWNLMTLWLEPAIAPVNMGQPFHLSPESLDYIWEFSNGHLAGTRLVLDALINS